MLRPILFTLLAAIHLGAASAQSPLQLLAAEDPAKGWSFNNGQEFGGGAKGALENDPAATRGGKPSLKLTGDFTKAGLYVQAGKQFEKTEVKDLSMWVKNPGADRFTMRLIDGSGQCHQIVLLTEPTDDWQRITFPIEEFFSRLGQSNAVQGVAKYESWGGAKDGKWHQPATAIFLLLSKTSETSMRTLWINDVTFTPKPPETFVKASVPIGEGTDGWRFTNGQEFPGAKGSFEEEDGALKLAGDFTGGGAYVAAVRDLSDTGTKDITSLRLKYRTANADFIRIQLVDATGQTHQTRLKVTADDKWNDLGIVPEKIAGGEHWGGANDGKWHGSPKQISIAVNDK